MNQLAARVFELQKHENFCWEKNFRGLCKYRAENIQKLDFTEQSLNVFGIILMMLCFFFTSYDALFLFYISVMRGVAIIISNKDTRYELDSIVSFVHIW